MLTKEVGIVILNYRNWQDTLKCLESVKTFKPPVARVFLVDNDSRNESIEQISSWLQEHHLPFCFLQEQNLDNFQEQSEKYILIQANSNRGYAAGNNLGIQVALRAEMKYLLILNNDIIVNKNFLTPLTEWLDTHPQAAITGPLLIENDKIDPNCARKRPGWGDYFFRTGPGRILWPSNPWIRSAWYFGNKGMAQPTQVDIVSGSCFLIRAEVFSEIGLLDENTFLLAEEFILSEKLRQVGYETWIHPASRIVHKHGKSIGKNTSVFFLKHFLKSHYYYLIQYRHFLKPTAMFILLDKYILYGLLRCLNFIRKALKTKETRTQK